MKDVVEFLRETVEKYPTKIACIDDEKEITFSQLWDKSEQIASRIEEYIEKGQPTPVMMKKGCDALCVLWGVIKAGGAYVIIDNSLPQERVKKILDTIEAKYIVSDLSDAWFSTEYRILEYLSLCNGYGKKKVENYDMNMPLYIMFTSGSTGTPKGVSVSRRAVSSFICSFVSLFHIASDDIIGNQAPWDFDVSVKDIFSSALTGATLVTIDKKYFMFPVKLKNFLSKHSVSTLIWAVSALCILSSRGDLEDRTPPSIRKVIFSGEVMPMKQFDIWRKVYPNAMFVNIYGPTEVTCNCTYKIIEHDFLGDMLPIGVALPNKKVFLLDEEDKLVDKPNFLGEICVVSEELADGYYKQPDETEKKFTRNPVSTEYERMYRTGDLAYYNENGELIYKTRKDFQIKYLGHRIELTEVEMNIEKIDGIRRCCCFFDNEIIAVCEGRCSGNVVNALRKSLPMYMIPTKWFYVDSLPINKNGKVNRNKILSEICAVHDE